MIYKSMQKILILSTLLLIIGGAQCQPESVHPFQSAKPAVPKAPVKPDPIKPPPKPIEPEQPNDPKKAPVPPGMVPALVNHLQQKFQPFRAVFITDGEKDNIESIENTIKLNQLLFDKKNDIIHFAKNIYHEIKNGRTSFPNPAFPSLVISSRQQTELFRDLIESYIVSLQYKANLSYAPVFETVEVLSLSGNYLPDNHQFEQLVLPTLDAHLVDGATLLARSTQWLEKHPLYLRDFFKNAFFQTYEGCLPIKNVHLSNWLESKTANHEGRYIYDHYIILKSLDQAIALMSGYYREYCIQQLILKDPQVQFLPFAQIYSRNDFQQLFNRDKFLAWVGPKIQLAYKSQGYAPDGDFANPKKYADAIDNLGIF